MRVHDGVFPPPRQDVMQYGIIKQRSVEQTCDHNFIGCDIDSADLSDPPPTHTRTSQVKHLANHRLMDAL